MLILAKELYTDNWLHEKTHTKYVSTPILTATPNFIRVTILFTNAGYSSLFRINSNTSTCPRLDRYEVSHHLLVTITRVQVYLLDDAMSLSYDYFSCIGPFTQCHFTVTGRAARTQLNNKCMHIYTGEQECTAMGIIDESCLHSTKTDQQLTVDIFSKPHQTGQGLHACTYKIEKPFAKIMMM